MCCFYLADFKISFFSFGFQQFDYDLSSMGTVFDLFFLGLTEFLQSLNLCLSPNMGRLGALFKYLLCTNISLCSLWDSSEMHVKSLIQYHGSLRFFSLLYSNFFLCFSDRIISINLISNLLVLSSIIYVSVMNLFSEVCIIYFLF